MSNPKDQNPFLLGRIKYVKGSASRPQAGDNRTIAIFCTDTGGFEEVERNEELSKTWEKAKTVYRAWWRSQKNFKTGNFQAEQIMSDTEVAHLISCVRVDNETFFEEEATRNALDALGKHCSMNKTNVHINKCGSEKEWEVIEGLIAETLQKRGVHVFVYENE